MKVSLINKNKKIIKNQDFEVISNIQFNTSFMRVKNMQ